MDRGLRAQLSPNELATLKRVASGFGLEELRASDVAHLVVLQLVEGVNGVWRPTEMGLLRMASEEQHSGCLSHTGSER